MALPKPSPFGALLRSWRMARRMSQLELSLAAGVSARHLSFLETGRSQPSRDMVLALTNVLEVPLRERNALLSAAGYAPMYRETDLEAEEMQPIRRALEFLLARQEPYPTIACDRGWNIRMQNVATIRVIGSMLPPKLATDEPLNAVRLIFSDRGLRPYVVNWTEVAESMIQRMHREIMAEGQDCPAQTLLAEALASGAPESWRSADLSSAPAPIVPLHLRCKGLDLRLFSALTMLGSPSDVTVQELRIETFFPADDATDKILRSMAVDSPS